MHKNLLALSILALLIVSGGARSQSVILQGGPWTNGHTPMYVGSGSGQTTVQDSGPAGGGGVGVGLSELLLAARGNGTPPYAGQGSGPLGTNMCDYDAPITNPTGYHYLCFSANADGGGLIVYGASPLATTLPFSIIANGAPWGGGGGGGGTLYIGATPIVGANGILYNNSGFLGALSIIPASQGGTGVNNGTSTLTLGSPILITGGAMTLAFGNASNTVSFPNASDTVVELTQTQTLTNKSIDGSEINSGTVAGTYLAAINMAASGNGGVTGLLGVANGGTGGGAWTPNLPLIGNNTGALAQGTVSGNTTIFATSKGTLISGDCVSIDSNLNLVDAGGPCTTGSGSGTVGSGTINDLAYYGSTGTAVTGLATGNNGVLITSGAGVPSISSTLPAAVQANITGTGTLVTGGTGSGFTINATTIGASTASTGAFTTLSASSTVSGTGFSTYLASPPAIGGTLAAAAKFTTLGASGAVTFAGLSSAGVVCNSSAGLLSTTTGVCPGSSGAGTRAANPVNFYVASGGSDSANCLTSGTACLTIQHVVNVIETSYDLQAAQPTINVGAGDFVGFQVNGSAVGSGGGVNGIAPITVTGTGISTTVIGSQTCSNQDFTVEANYGAVLFLGGMTITNTCAGGGDLAVQFNSVVEQVNGQMYYNSGVNSQDANIFVYDHSTFYTAYTFTMAGNSIYAFDLSTHGSAVLTCNCTYTIAGGPAYSGAFAAAVDHSFFNYGNGVGGGGFTGSASGPKYYLALLSNVDSEQETNGLPGSTRGVSYGGSWYYDEVGGGATAGACAGGTSGCAAATGPTGLGSGGSNSMTTGPTSHIGEILLTAGTGASTSGTAHMATNSIMYGGGTGGFCTVSPGFSSTQWPTGTTIQGYYNASGILVYYWTTSSALVSGATYAIDYNCD